MANESSGGGKADPAFAEMLGQAGIPEWGDSTEWQYWVIDTVKRHEAEMGYQRHPIGMTMQFPVPEQTKVNEPLFDSRAEWISPGCTTTRSSPTAATPWPRAPRSPGGWRTRPPPPAARS